MQRPNPMHDRSGHDNKLLFLFLRNTFKVFFYLHVLCVTLWCECAAAVLWSPWPRKVLTESCESLCDRRRGCVCVSVSVSQPQQSSTTDWTWSTPTAVTWIQILPQTFIKLKLKILNNLTDQSERTNCVSAQTVTLLHLFQLSTAIYVFINPYQFVMICPFCKGKNRHKVEKFPLFLSYLCPEGAMCCTELRWFLWRRRIQ